MKGDKIMFTQIIKESTGMEYIHVAPLYETANIESIAKELDSYISEATNVGYLVEEIDNSVGGKGFIQRVVEMFKRFISRIKEWLSNVFFSTEKKMYNMVSKLNAVDYHKIVVDAPEKINSLGTQLAVLDSAANELGNFRTDTIINTIKEKSLIGKAAVAYQVWKGTFLSGYVSHLKMYDGMEIPVIKSKFFGDVKPISNIDITQFYKNFEFAKKFKSRLDSFSSDYEKAVFSLESGIKLSKKSGAMNSEVEKTVSGAVKICTEFFNRNINLITALVVETTKILMHVTSEMVKKVGNHKVGV